MKMTRQTNTSRTDTELVEVPFYGVRLNRTHTFLDGKYKGRRVCKEIVLTYDEIEQVRDFIEDFKLA